MATTTRIARLDYTEGMATRTLADGTEQVFETCWKCGGSGEYPSPAWQGVCLACWKWGTRSGGHWVGKDDYNRRAHNRAVAAARRERKAAAEAAERDARIPRLHEELTEAHPLLAELTYLGNVDFNAERGPLNYGGILGDLRRKLEQYGSLSEKQIALAEKIIREDYERQARRDAEAAERAARPNAAIGEVGDRLTFTGTVRWFDYFSAGVYGGVERFKTVVVLATDEGTVKWSATGSLNLEKGQQLTIKATVKEHSIYEKTGEITTVVTRGTIL
jgi:hypothetical protein